MLFFKRLTRYGSLANSHDVIKAVAILLMITDHIGLYVFDNNLWFRLVGRASAPLFFFATGYVSTHRLRFDIFMYGAILTALTYFTRQTIYLNILLNFMLIHGVLTRYNPKQFSSSHLLAFFILASLGHFFISPWLEYGFFGLLCAIGARLLAQRDLRAYYWLAGSVALYFFYESFAFNFIARTELEAALMGICILLIGVFYFYRWQRFTLPKIINGVALFLGRYSLEVYFWHLVAFIGWAYWMR